MIKDTIWHVPEGLEVPDIPHHKVPDGDCLICRQPMMFVRRVDGYKVEHCSNCNVEAYIPEYPLGFSTIED